VSGAGAGPPTSLGATRAAWVGARAGGPATARAQGYTASGSLGVQRRSRKRTERTREPGAAPACPGRPQAHRLGARPLAEGLPRKGPGAFAQSRDGPRQRLRQARPGVPLAWFCLEAGQGTQPCRLVAPAQRRRYGQGPRELAMPALLARRAPALARRFLGPLAPATRGDNILHAGAAVESVECIAQHEAAQRAAPRHRWPQIQGLRSVGLGRGQDGACQGLAQRLAQLVILGEARQGACEWLWPSRRGKACGNARTVGGVGALLPELGQVVWPMGRVDMGQPCTPFPPQVGAAAEEGARRAPRSGRDRRLREPAPAEQEGNVWGIERRVLGLATVHGWQREPAPGPRPCPLGPRERPAQTRDIYPRRPRRGPRGQGRWP
jgi:hypothetical protein